MPPARLSQLGTPNGSDTAALRVINGGLVGIGTNAPSAGLHITTRASILAPNVLALSGNLLAIAAKLDNAVTLVDVSNPANPVLRATLKNGVGGFNELAGAYGSAFSGNLLAIAARNGREGTRCETRQPDPLTCAPSCTCLRFWTQKQKNSGNRKKRHGSGTGLQLRPPFYRAKVKE